MVRFLTNEIVLKRLTAEESGHKKNFSQIHIKNAADHKEKKRIKERKNIQNPKNRVIIK